jgi:hypothetical protein
MLQEPESSLNRTLWNKLKMDEEEGSIAGFGELITADPDNVGRDQHHIS